MNTPFTLPPGMIGRFAVVKLWPKVKAAEDENVARLKVTAKSLGLECVEITPDGRLLEAPHALQTQADLDFVIHLHFETPKAYDVFSFVALWNPIQFYHEWGYRRFSRHLLTHDDFLSCSSTWTDDHVRRLIAQGPPREGPAFTMYHSLSDPILEPTLGDQKIFYAGINWERLGRKKGRHQELLDLLDPTGDLRIHGPKIFQGVDVWQGYKSYAGPIPFDGTSLIREINRCGIALVLSSDAHKQSELMSNRLFESLAGGAFVICDENSFAKRHFGDTLLYIDASLPTEQVFADVQRHVAWIKASPNGARAMAQRAQALFRERFALDRSLINIYTNLRDRQATLERCYAPADRQRAVELFLLLPEFDLAVLRRQINNALTQRHAGTRAVLLIDEHDLAEHVAAIQSETSAIGDRIRVQAVRFVDRDASGTPRRRRLGQVLTDLILALPADHQFCIVAPNEELFAEHVQSLAGALERNPEANVAHSDVVYRHEADSVLHHDLNQDVDYLDLAAHRPLGFGRFLFRRSAVKPHLEFALPYVDFCVIALLLATSKKRAATVRGTVICDFQSAYPVVVEKSLQLELEVIRDYCPDMLTQQRPAALGAMELEPASLSLKRLSDANRTNIAVELAHSVPLPPAIKKMIFGTYRMWLNRKR